jgi:hypothetical protein
MIAILLATRSDADDEIHRIVFQSANAQIIAVVTWSGVYITATAMEGLLEERGIFAAGGLRR